MAGHSHWANIKHKKARVDAKRAKVWGKIAKKIMVAAKGGSDPTDNLALRYVIDEAKASNMPKGTIENAVAKGAGELGGQTFEEIVYEGYAPGGVAILLEILTDNRNRTAGEIRNLFDRNGGNLATSGSVAFQFQKKGIIAVETSKSDEDTLMELALEAGAEDVINQGEIYEIVTDPTTYAAVKDALTGADIEVADAELKNVPDTTVELDVESATKVVKLIDLFDDQDDVQTVSHNAEIPEEALA
ncbi:MAG: YebC/PmpR family DNA-binding transcriptional regulator [Planctomycetota bacterium]